MLISQGLKPEVSVLIWFTIIKSIKLTAHEIILKNSPVKKYLTLINILTNVILI